MLHVNNNTQPSISSIEDTANTREKVLRPISHLPSHILLQIFAYLKPATLLQTVAVTTKNWRQLSQDEILMKNIIKRHFPYLSRVVSKEKELNANQYCQKLLYEMNSRLDERKKAQWILATLPEFFNKDRFSSLTICYSFGFQVAFDNDHSSLSAIQLVKDDKAFNGLFDDIFGHTEKNSNKRKRKQKNPMRLDLVVQDIVKNKKVHISLCDDLTIGRPTFQYQNTLGPYPPALKNIEAFKQILAGSHPRYKLLNQEQAEFKKHKQNQSNANQST